jgi:hypothetical protein
MALYDQAEQTIDRDEYQNLLTIMSIFIDTRSGTRTKPEVWLKILVYYRYQTGSNGRPVVLESPKPLKPMRAFYRTSFQQKFTFWRIQ